MIIDRLREAKERMPAADIHALALEAGLEGENYALFVSALSGGTVAIGAALALVERLMPDTGVSFYVDPKKDGGKTTCCLHYRRDCTPSEFAQNATPALAILTALFTALAAKENG